LDYIANKTRNPLLNKNQIKTSQQEKHQTTLFSTLCKFFQKKTDVLIRFFKKEEKMRRKLFLLQELALNPLI